MDSNLNQYTQHSSPAKRGQELYGNLPGDFMNAEDLRQHLGRVIEIINRANGPGTNPLPGGIPSPQNSSILSITQPVNMQNKIPSEIIPAGNISTPLPAKEVLMEPCTVSQPMNASLRKFYSKGSFYFLNK